MIPLLFYALLLLLAALLAALWAADYRVTHAANWESIDRWLLIGSYAAPAAFITFGATVGAGLAWWIA